MEQQEVTDLLWEEIVVDFGHELITAVHTPIAWSDQRPGEEEFKESFSKVKLDAGKILSFVASRRSSLKRIVLMNSEGYYSEVSFRHFCSFSQVMSPRSLFERQCLQASLLSQSSRLSSKLLLNVMAVFWVALPSLACFLAEDLYIIGVIEQSKAASSSIRQKQFVAAGWRFRQFGQQA